MSGTPRAAVYRVIAENGRNALSKATRHVSATESHFVAAVQLKKKHVDASSYRRDCELYLLEEKNPGDREDTREPFREDLAP